MAGKANPWKVALGLCVAAVVSMAVIGCQSLDSDEHPDHEHPASEHPE